MEEKSKRGTWRLQEVENNKIGGQLQYSEVKEETQEMREMQRVHK